MKAQTRNRGMLYSFFNLGARWGWVVNATPRPLYPGERDPLPIVREAGWAPGLSGRVRKISPQPRFDCRTVQPVASDDTDWAMICVSIHKLTKEKQYDQNSCCPAHLYKENLSFVFAAFLECAILSRKSLCMQTSVVFVCCVSSCHKLLQILHLVAYKHNTNTVHAMLMRWPWPVLYLYRFLQRDAHACLCVRACGTHKECGPLNGKQWHGNLWQQLASCMLAVEVETARTWFDPKHKHPWHSMLTRDLAR
jgi:hypothetical protein